MANVYVRSLAAGTGTGADWTNAFTTLAAAFTAKAAGDTFWVSEDHAETQASALTATSPGTSAAPCFVYCVNHAGSVPPVSADLRTTATISATGVSNINLLGVAYVYGVTFKGGNAANQSSIIIPSSGGAVWILDSCALVLNNTASLSSVLLGISAGAGQCIVLNNTTMTFGAITQGITYGNARITWKNTPSALGGAVFPTALFLSTAVRGGTVYLEGVDLSALGSGKTIFDATATAQSIVLKDCKLGASVTVSATPASQGGTEVLVIRSDSSSTNYRAEKYRYEGTETVETTIVRTGGASDGTTSIAKKIVTTANSKWVLPFEAIPIAIWNDSTASVTVTVYGIWGGGAVPNNDDIWMDVEYLGSALTPQGSFATATKADNLATGSALSTDTSTWGGSTTKFKMTATFTPAQKGAIYIYIKAAKASTTFYIDPKPELS
jgi:hypothetical protein